MRSCEYPGCDAEESDVVDIHTYGFTVDGMVENERDYCGEHAPTSDVIDP